MESKTTRWQCLFRERDDAFFLHLSFVISNSDYKDLQWTSPAIYCFVYDWSFSIGLSEGFSDYWAQDTSNNETQYDYTQNNET